MKKTIIALLALAFTLALVLPALAQDPAASATAGLSATSATTRSAGPTELTGSAAAQPAQSSGQAQNLETKPLRKEIVKLKYVRAQDIQNLLYAYVSREGHIQFNPNMPSILSVSDTPENVDKILAAIREIDVKPADVLYTVQLVLGSETDAATDAELKNDPDHQGARQAPPLQGLHAPRLHARPRHQPGAGLGRPGTEGRVRVRAQARCRRGRQDADHQNRGEAGSDGRQKEPDFTKPDGTEVMGGTSTSHVTLIESTLNIKSGERTVVGVSKLDGGDKGLILIISAKIVD